MAPFSTAAQGMRSSAIRELMKLAADPSVISFAGGMPNNGLFPTDDLDELYNALPVEVKQAGFQYGPTGGYPPLLASLREYLRGRGLPVDSNDLIITTGAQQALNLLAKVFVDPGDTVVTEYPSFIGAVAGFRSYGARLQGVPMDDDGIDIDALGAVLDAAAAQSLKLLYLCPCFHNPAGNVYTLERKRAVLDTLVERDVVLIEDDPYSELYFDDADKPLTQPMKALGEEPVPIAYVGSFAKIFGPGMRLGWLLAPADIVAKVELAKQSMDAGSSTFTQVLANAYLSEGRLPGYLANVRPIYKRRAETMLGVLTAYMPKNVSWTTPRGGFYIWVRLPESVDATDVFNRSIARGAAFVVGSAFDPEGTRNNCFRLAFSHAPEDRIEEGTKIVCEAVREAMGG